MAAATASVAAWKSVDEAMDTVTIKTGATGQALTDMQDRAKNIASTIPTSFQTAADAVGEVNTRFGLAGDDLEKLSTQFTKFAEMNKTDVSTSIDDVSKVLASFGEDSSQASGLLDAMNVVGQKTGIDMGELAQTMQKNASQFRQMGYDAKTSAAYMSLISTSGLDASVVMKGMQKASASAAKDGKSLNDKLQEFTKIAATSKNQATVLQSAYETFGTKAGGAIANAVQNGTLSLTGFGDLLGDFAGSVDSTFEATQDPLDKFTMVLNKLKITGADIVDAAAPMITQAADMVLKAVTTIKNAWEGLDPSMQQNILKFAMMAAAVGPLISVFGGLVTHIAVLGVKLSGIAKAGGIIKVAMAAITGPAGIVIAAIIALIAVGVLLYKNWDKVSASLKKLGQTLSSIFAPQINAIKTAWGNLVNAFTSNSGKFSALGSKFQSMGLAIMSALKPMIQFIVSFWMAKIKIAFAAVSGYVEGFSAQLETIIGGVIKILDGLIDFITGVFSGNWEQAWNGIKEIVSGIVESIIGLVKGMVNGIASAINSVIGAINGMGITIPDWVPGVGGQSFHVNVPKIPMLANGTDDWRGGPAMINERGGEIVDLPQGARVYPHDESVQKAKGDGKKITVKIAKLAEQIIVREDADIDKIADKLTRRLVETASNMGGVSVADMD